MENTFFKDWQALIDSFEALKKSEDNPFFKSKFVPLKIILPLVKTHCRTNNFIFMQVPLLVDGKNTLQTTFLHESGEKVSGRIEIVAKDGSDPQKVGAGITYMRRYSFTCMLGLEEDDDDGNTAASDKPKTSKEKLSEAKNVPELEKIFKSLPANDQTNVDLINFCKELKANNFIPIIK